jgi:hypothetical protein
LLSINNKALIRSSLEKIAVSIEPEEVKLA